MTSVSHPGEVSLDVVSPCIRCSGVSEKKCSACKAVFYCSRECQKRDWRRHKQECLDSRDQDQDRFEELPDETGLDLKVEVRPSPGRGGGLGVFATAAAAKGERLCHFFGETREARMRVSVSRSAQGVVSIKNAEEVFSLMASGREEADRCLAHPDQRRRGAVRIGDREHREGFGVGQFVNDRSRPEVAELDFGLALAAMEKYAADSVAGSNCEMRQDFWFVATRDVGAGEEILTHYGIQFWLNKYLLEATDPSFRFLFYALMDQAAKPFDLRRFFDYDEDTCKEFLRVLIGVGEDRLAGQSAKKIVLELTEAIQI